MTEDKRIEREVFMQGEEGCHTYRIPSLIQATDGTLIALAEGRRDNSGDPGQGHIDLVYKTSKNGGESWSDRRFLDRSVEGWSASNPTAVLERDSGRVFVLFNRWKPGRGGRNSRAGTLDNQLWLRYSDDNGETWSDAVDITEQGRDVRRWGKAVFGPGHGIQTGKGRLVVPVNAPRGKGDDLQNTASFALYSDDEGENWKRGKQIGVPTSENQIVELDDGRLLMDARQRGKDVENRWVAFSTNHGESWSKPCIGQIVTQICAGVARCPRPDDEEGSVLLWSAPKGPGRENLVLRISDDQGVSFPTEIMVGPGPAAYSDMAALNDGSAGILWEGGENFRYEKIFFTRIYPAFKMLSRGENYAENQYRNTS